MAKNDDELETSDYKLSKSGKKIKAHRIVFNKGEEDNTKLREESMTDDQKAERERIVKGMKKNYKGFVAKYGKDRAKSVMYATATKAAMKEETEILDEAAISTVAKAHGFEKVKSGFEKGSYKHPKTGETITALRGGSEYGHSRKDGSTVASFNHKSSLEGHLAKHGYKKTVSEELKGNQVKLDKNKNGKLDAEDFKKLRKEDTALDEAHPFDIPKSGSGMSSSTRTMHDVKKTSTGTVYTKQRDSEGNSKEFKRDPDQAKRGRGRPKKNSFSEAAEFLMSLDEEMFDELMSEGFDAFVEQYEQLDELSKTTLGNYVKKATSNIAKHAEKLGASKMGDDTSKNVDKLFKRRVGVNDAVKRLTK